MSNIYNDPDFKKGWDSQTAHGRFLRKLGGAIRDTPGTIIGILQGDPGTPQSGGDPVEFAEEAVAGGIEGLGWPDEEEVAGTPRVAPSARAESPAPADEAPDSAPDYGEPAVRGEQMGTEAALMDAMEFGVSMANSGIVYDALSELAGRDVLSPSGLGELNKMYNEKTGGSGYRTLEELTTPAALEILLRG